MASHAPAAMDRDALSSFVSAMFPESGSWRAIHILSSGCRCSRKVAENLIRRRTISSLRETVIILGSPDPIQGDLRQAGFEVRQIPAETAAETYHLRGAPWLLFVSPDGSIRYAGGYASTNDARAGYQDLAIWSKLQTGQTVPELPLFGCVVGKRLQRISDPVGLNYRN